MPPAPCLSVMLRNYFHIAIRNLKRNPLYSLLNIGGLAAGLAVSILIGLYVAHEYSFDRFHPQAERIFKTLGRAQFGEQTIQTTAMSAQFGYRTKQALPQQVENYVRIRNAPRAVLQTDAAFHSFEDKLAFADESVFKVFHFPLAKGKPSLSRPNTVVLSEKLASKYFGKTDPVGKTLTLDGHIPLEITGVMENIPSRSTLQYDALISFDTQKNLGDEGLTQQLTNTRVQFGSFETYFLLRSGEAKTAVERTIQRLQQREEGERREKPDTFTLEKLTDLHLNGSMQDHSQQYHRLFLGIAVAILLLALINYMNLTTARATRRAREVGVRKALGGLRSDLIAQFYTESALMTLLAFGLSLLLVEGLRPVFFGLLELPIDDTFSRQPLFWSGIIGLAVITALLAGSYPALLLSGFMPAKVLKGSFVKTEGNRVRQSLTVFQFAISVGLIVCTLVVKQQLDFLRKQSPGIERGGVVVVPLPESLAPRYISFRNELKQQPGIQELSVASWPLYKSGVNAFFVKTKKNKEVFFWTTAVDEAFFSTLNVPWKIRPAATRTTAYPLVINESAVSQLDLNRQAVGEKVDLAGHLQEVTGVVADFHLFSGKGKMGGLGMQVVPDTSRALVAQGGCLYLKLRPDADVPRTLAAVSQVFARHEKTNPFEYYFLDEAYDALYKAESKLSTMLAVFTGIAILIACLGLFGLAAFSVETRRKEIGIRKVLGAGVSGILFLLSRDFLRLVLISNLLAFPVAWYFLDSWIKDYAVRIPIGWVWFAVSGLLALTVALLTVGAQALRAAQADPVRSLRAE
jgi:putative ABC transport system permease protein